MSFGPALRLVSCFLLALTLARPAATDPLPGAALATKPQVVLLKFDDVTTNGAHGKAPIAPRWQKLADYLTANQIKGSFGIICSSLEKDAPAYFQWIKDVQAAGLVEFWLHGYRERTQADPQGEFEVGTAEQQRAIFQKSEALARAKLGFSLAAFGPHWSGTTDATDEALAGSPAVKLWLYGPKRPKFYRGLSLERIMALENPTFVPDAQKFRATYERLAAHAPVLVLQGHPNAWTDERWAGFVEIIAYLRSRHVVFMTPSEYLATLGQ
jgi:peptidoglycan/xylan/chitin deacetylase (PgdA/CDA1 family)